MSTAATENPRMAKFRRVLARLRPDRDIYLRNDAIRIVLDEPLSERCDVLARLVHAASGRTYAQAERMLDETSTALELGNAINIPDDDYEIVLSPPLGEYHGITPYAVRHPVVIDTDRRCIDPEAELAARRKTATERLTAARLPISAVARIEAGRPDEVDIELLASVLPDAEAELVFAVAGISAIAQLPCKITSCLSEALMRLAKGEDPIVTFGARILTGKASGDDDTGLGAVLRQLGLVGPDSGFSSEGFAALLALAGQYDRTDLAALVEAVLDRVALDLAMRIRNGASEIGHAETLAAWLWWGVGTTPDSGSATLLALNVSRYEPHPLLHAIALDVRHEQDDPWIDVDESAQRLDVRFGDLGLLLDFKDQGPART